MLLSMKGIILKAQNTINYCRQCENVIQGPMLLLSRQSQCALLTHQREELLEEFEVRTW